MTIDVSDVVKVASTGQRSTRRGAVSSQYKLSSVYSRCFVNGLGLFTEVENDNAEPAQNVIYKCKSNTEGVDAYC